MIREIIGEMLETESTWIMGLGAITSVICGVGAFGFVLYNGLSAGGEWPWYAWLGLAALCGFGGLVGGFIAGIALYIVISVGLGLCLAGLIFAGLGAFIILLMEIWERLF